LGTEPHYSTLGRLKERQATSGGASDLFAEWAGEASGKPFGEPLKDDYEKLRRLDLIRQEIIKFAQGNNESEAVSQLTVAETL
jgi:hypothetical protein